MQNSTYSLQVDPISFFIDISKTLHPALKPLKVALDTIFTPISSPFSTSNLFESCKLKWANISLEEELIKIENDDENKSAFIEALKSPHFHLLRPQMKIYFESLSNQTVDEYLKKVAVNSLETQDTTLVGRALALLPCNRWIALLKETVSKNFDLKNEIETFLMKENIKKKKMGALKKTSFLSHELQDLYKNILRLSTYYLRLIITSLQSFVSQEAPKSAWDACFQLEVYYRILSIPLALYTFTQSRVEDKKKHAALFTAALLTLIGALYSYRKWLEPKPEKLPFGVNYTELVIKEKGASFFVGREEELDTVISQLKHNLISQDRHHCLIQGAPGTGKTTFIKGLARRLLSLEKNDKLYGAEVHLISAGEIINKSSSYDNKTPYQQILAAIGCHKEKMIVVIDDINLLLKKDYGKLLSLLQTTSSDNELPLFIGITPINLKSDEELKKLFIEYGYARRFKKINFNENDKTEMQTVEIMRGVKDVEYPLFDLEKSLFKKIYEKGKELKASGKIAVRSEPSRSTTHLKEIIDAAEKEKDAGKLEKLRSKKNRKGELEAELLKLEGERAYKMKDTISQLEKEISQLKKEISNQDEKIIIYQKKRAALQQKEVVLKGVAKKISLKQEMSLKEETEETELIKHFLFNQFYFLPEVKKDLDSFANDNDLNFTISESMVEAYFKKLGV